MQLPQLSVVIPTFRNSAVLRRVLDGYERQDAPASCFEVIVVVDFSDPDPGAVDRVIAGRRVPVRRVTGALPGASGARNAGWRVAGAPLVLFTDDDTIPAPRLVSEHLRGHRDHPDDPVAVLGHVRWARDLAVTPFMRWLEAGVQFEFDSIRDDQASWAHLYSSNVSLKRSFLERLGGFDAERFPFGYEDLDLGYRAHQLGLRVIYNRRATVDHWRPMTLELWKRKASRIGTSARRFHERYPELAPTLWQRFSDAAARPAQRGRATRVVRFVPRKVPYLGPLLWNLADLYWCQEIAPHFLAAWDQAGRGGGPVAAPGHSALAERTLEP
ncbi:MAG: glycosyltransferase [Actinomycetota bacterium]|nr:glycosyltransferase [Actinomycetota bacterium]